MKADYYIHLNNNHSIQFFFIICEILQIKIHLHFETTVRYLVSSKYLQFSVQFPNQTLDSI